MLQHKTTEDRDDLDEPTLEEAAKRLPNPPGSWQRGAVGRVVHAAHRLKFLQEVHAAYRYGGTTNTVKTIRKDAAQPETIEAACKLLPAPPSDWRQDDIGKMQWAASRIAALEEALVSFRLGPVHRAPERCDKHRRYQAKRAPQSGCPVCTLMWEAKQQAQR